MSYEVLRLIVLGQGLVICLFAVAWVRGRVRMRAARRRIREVVRTSEDAALRRLRLASHDLRAIGMTLHGNADDLGGAGLPHAASIATAAFDVFEMADDLYEYTAHGNAGHGLREEEIHLAVLLDDTVKTVSAAIAPGRRQWHVTPEIAATLLRADRRALRHMLTRALTSVVRNTRHEGLIEVSLHIREDGLALLISNDPAGALSLERVPDTAQDSRGSNLRLNLARTLMEAHGGKLEVEARRDLCMQLGLIFPTDRICHSPVHAAGQAPPPGEMTPA